MNTEWVGYKLMLAFEGTEAPERILRWAAERPLGGFTLFRHYNVESAAQVRELTAFLQKTAQDAGYPPLLIAGDQEGGQLIALGDDTTPFPGNMALGATFDPALARQVGAAIGREMRAMGYNVNYAPVCDLNSNPANPSLGIRAFGDDPQAAAEMAAALVQGLQASGVAATAKHFPGKGEAAVDSHYQMPLIDKSREQLAAGELRPFQAAIDAGVKLIMSGHFAIPAITGSDVPATLSRAVMRDMIRQEMGFEGVVITDALDMGAITQGAGQIIDVIAAVRAGVDLLLLKADPELEERLYAGLQLAWSRGLIGEEHVIPSIRYTHRLRKWAGEQPQPDLDVVGCAAHQQLARQVAERSITLLRDEAGLLPLRLNSAARIAAIMPRPKELTPADTSAYVRPSLAEALRFHHPRVDEFIVSHPPTETEIARLKAKAAQYDLLIIGTINASMDERQADLVNELLDTAAPAVTVALRAPYDLTVYPWSETHVCAYGILRPSMEALAAALWGDIPFTGRLPVEIPGLYPRGWPPS